MAKKLKAKIKTKLFATKEQYKIVSSFCKGVAQTLFVEAIGLPLLLFDNARFFCYIGS